MQKVLIVCSILTLALSAGAAELTIAPQMVIPAAASSSGLHGSYWKTEVVVFNPTDRSLHLTAEVVPSLNEVAPPALPLGSPVGQGGTLMVPDLLGAVFPGVEFGAVVLTGRDPDGNPAPFAAVSRTWAAGEQLNFGQGMPAVPWSGPGTLRPTSSVVTGLEQSQFFRSNLGLVNLTHDRELEFVIEFLDGEGRVTGEVDLALPPWSTRHLTNVLGMADLSGAGHDARVRLRDEEASEGVDYLVYASKVDQATNDPTTLEVRSAVPGEVVGPGPERAGFADFRRHRLVVPGLAHHADARSALILGNPGDDRLVVEVSILGPGGHVLAGFEQVLAPGATVREDDVLANLGLHGDAMTAEIRILASDSGTDGDGEPARLEVHGIRVDPVSQDVTVLPAFRVGVARGAGLWR